MHWDPPCKCPEEKPDFCEKCFQCGLGVLVIDQIWKYVMCTVYMYITNITVHIRYIIYIYVHIFVSI